MGEYFRKEFRRKGDYPVNKNYQQNRGVPFKVDKEAYAKKPNAETSQQPTILIKARDNERAASPGTSSVTASTPKKSGETAASYQIQAKTPSNEIPAPPLMPAAVPLLSADMCSLQDTCLEFLSDESDFLVVGCLGCQGVGKSTLMSLLAHPNMDPSEPEKFVFAQQTLEDQTGGRSVTSGIELFVTSRRIILLDCQPTLAATVPSNTGNETNSEMQSLELAAFLFSVCHVVLFVQDYFLDPDLIRFLQTAEMLKPSTSTAIGETMVEYFPHLVFVHNMAEDWEFQAQRIKLIQESYLKAFSHSRLQIQTGFGIANGDVSPVLDVASCGELVNVFLLPQIASDDEVYTGHPRFKDLFRQLRSQILSTPRTPISHALLTERKWFQYASKVWEGIQKSSFFNEYHRLISNI